MKTRRIAAMLALAGTLAAGRVTWAESIWVEGEAPLSHTFQKHGWYDGVRKDVLSGGDWLSHYGPAPGEAVYAVEVKKTAAFAFWVRCNNLYVSQAYRLDSGPWKPCDFTLDQRETQHLSPKPDHRNLAWHRLGKVDLRAGEHRIAFRLDSKIENHGGIDCFLLSSDGFEPSGKIRPEGLDAAGPEDWFPVLIGDAPSSPRSVTDMSGLLHQPAGRLGPIERRGDRLVAGGRELKFWGCGADIAPGRDPAWHEARARYLARHGVNMVRQHPVQEHLGLLRPDGTFDPERLAEWDEWFAALRKHGIYMTWSPFYPHRIRAGEGYDLFDELPRRGDTASTSGLVNIEPALQESEWRWLKALLLHRNPRTGKRYVDDPALAVIEVHNEDCIFWHAPLNDLASGKLPSHTARLQRRWADWLRGRYASDQGLRAAWGQGLREGDSLANPAMGIYGAWEMKAAGPERRPQEKKRLGDFIRFLAELQRGYYQRREKELRDLGYRGLTVTTAWKAGGPAADPANLWCDDALDMIDRHNYFGGVVDPERGGHAMFDGAAFRHESHLDRPGSGLFAIGRYQVEDKPFAVTEWTSKPPNEWKAEAAPLFAFYGMGLQGWDASYHFLSSGHRLGSGWPGLSSYVSDTPHYLGQFPALAFALAKGHIREAPLAAARRVDLDAIFAGVDALHQDVTGGGYDEREAQGALETPAEVFAIGRLTAKIAPGAGAPERSDWARHWDRERRIIRSMTGELEWNYGDRIVRVLAPKTQAVIGFAGGRTIELPAVTVEVATPFVSLIFTPLDDRPLTSSRHVLITAMARDRQDGTEYSADRTRLVRAGTPPLFLEPVRARIAFAGEAPKAVEALDIHGVPAGRRVPVEDGAFAIDGRYRACYYQVKR